MYVGFYASLVDIAQIVAVADMVGGLPEKRRGTPNEAYALEAHRAHVMALDAPPP